MRVNSLKIPSILAVAVLAVGVAVGTALVQRQQLVQTEASAEKAPYNVTVSNIQDDSFTVSWTTDTPALGFLLWGDGIDPTTPAQSIGGGTKEVHMVKIKSLEPNTQYYFTINSGGTIYRDGDIPWKVVTGEKLDIPSTSKVISGIVETEEGQPVPHAVVTVSGEGMTTLSAITSSTGSWVIPLSLARTPDLTSYKELGDQKLEISVLNSNLEKATAKIKANATGSLPAIVMGKSHDFTALTVLEDLSSPNSQLDLPDEDVQGISSSSLVTLQSVDNGEVVFTSVPEFFGEGPAGEEISITVHSDPVSGTTTVEEDGVWTWSPLKNLENGLHNITLEWIDAQGIVHTLTRSFIVQAQENEPSFESTPSGGTSTPAPTPTATPRTTTTPKSTATPTASSSATPKVTSSATATGTPKGGNLPDAGSTTPTVLLAAVGFVTLSLGAFLTIKNK